MLHCEVHVPTDLPRARVKFFPLPQDLFEAQGFVLELALPLPTAFLLLHSRIQPTA